MKLHLNLSHGNNELIEYVIFMATFGKVSFTKIWCNKKIKGGLIGMGHSKSF